MINIIKGLRLPECILVVILGLIGFKFASIHPNIQTLVALFFVIAVTMLQNDWRDRVHDINKRKTFAHEKPVIFLSWLILFWIVCGIQIIMLSYNFPATSFLLLGMAFVGLIYSEARHIHLLSVFLVTFTVASSELIPVTFGAKLSTVLGLLITTSLIIFGRETLHDIADTDVDKGYKKTLPLYIGNKSTRIISLIALIIGCCFAVIISPISLIGSVFILWGLTKVMKDESLKWVRNRIDFGLIILSLSLLLM